MKGRIIFKGGAGSGNFGHSGRPGQVGGSGGGSGGGNSGGSSMNDYRSKLQEIATTYDVTDDNVMVAVDAYRSFLGKTIAVDWLKYDGVATATATDVVDDVYALSEAHGIRRRVET